MPLFQLGAGAQQHAAYIFFDNNLPGDDRLCIVCTIRKLNKEENEKAKQAIVERHGIGSLIRRRHTRNPSAALAEVQLEFFKYCIVFRGTSCRIFDVERLCELEPTSQQQLLRGETTVKQELALSHCEETGVKKAEYVSRTCRSTSPFLLNSPHTKIRKNGVVLHSVCIPVKLRWKIATGLL